MDSSVFVWFSQLSIYYSLVLSSEWGEMYPHDNPLRSLLVVISPSPRSLLYRG